MNILVLNCGSSSVKFQLIATDLEQIASNTDQRLAHGLIERIGGEAIITLQKEGRAPSRSTAPLRDARAALELILRWICSKRFRDRRHHKSGRHSRSRTSRCA
ncbi:MAG TPA: hypothetical protein VLR90_00665, partial [Blastocatellia bacterium]|nr:hypothetical protein [Blastocatellia bacterium]